MPDLENTDSLDQAHAYRLTRIARLLRYNLLTILSETSISPEQYFLLFRLKERDGRAHRELADPVLDDRPNITRLVNGMVAQGLVERRPDPNDGRRVLVYLTDHGREQIVGLDPLIIRARRDLFGGLSSDEMRVLERVLDELEARLS